MEVMEYELRKYRNSLGINAATKFGDHRKSGGQYHAQMTGNETIARQENPAVGQGGRGQRAEDSGQRSPAGTAENQGSEPEHDASWYSPSARAARITQSMIEHRLRKRRVEM